MKYKVHWLIDGLVEIEANNLDAAEKIVKDKIEAFVNNNSNFFQEIIFYICFSGAFQLMRFPFPR